MGLCLTSFLCGAVIMVVEILGFRLLPPYFGYSMAVWGALLGVVMVALSAGYALGGVLADRYPRPGMLYAMVLVALGYAVLLLVTYPAVLRAASRFGVLGGSLLAAAFLFAVPMTALGTVSPYVIRLLAREGKVGSAAGGVYAISTAGSIVGTFLTSFYLIPTHGSRASLAVVGATLGLVAGLGLLGATRGRARPVTVPEAPGTALVAAAGAAAPVGAQPRAASATPPAVRPAWLWIGAASLLVGVAVSGFAPPVLVELVGRDRQRWAERFAAGEEDVVVDVRDGEGRVPAVLPGPADAWAGSRPHRLQLRVPAARGDLLLRLVVREADWANPPRLTLSVDGREVGWIRLRSPRGGLRSLVGRGPGLEHSLAIPGGVLDSTGGQTVTLTNGRGGTVGIATLMLLSGTPTFALSHYVDPSPPPRVALLPLGLGLVALWAAHRRPIRENVAPLLALAAGLGLLVFLAAADWRVILITPRVLWILLVLGFAVLLAPSLTRLSTPRLIDVTAFVTGGVVMVLEIAGFRLLAPFFGYSSYIWGALLGVIMATLAIGYALGGWLADRWPSLRLLYQSLLVTAAVVLLIPFAHPFVIPFTVGFSLFSGSLLAATLLVFLPMVGLGVTAPFLIRLAAATGRVGVTAGRIYAISTVGSLVGTFVTAFYLVTALGPQEAWVVGGLLLLLLLVLAGHRAGRGSLVPAPWLGLALVLGQPLIPEMTVATLKGGIRLYDVESEYSHLEVIEVGKTVQLVPQLRFTHSIYAEGRAFEPIISFGLLPLFLAPEPRRMLHLGMGGGTLARVYLRGHPAIQVDGVDIDPEMIRLGKRFLGLREDPRLTIILADARAFVDRAPAERYDVLVWDLFQGGVFVPYYALTREFFEQARGRLTADGVLALFIARPRPYDVPGRPERYRRLFGSVGNTLASVFPSVFFYPVSEIGYYFVATARPTPLETARARLLAVEIPELRELVRETGERIAEYRADPGVPVLTDDWAPVDQMIYDAFFRE